jgi:DNA polymerase-4
MSGLRTLFVDMNAYFASVEQQDDPRLRGKPIGIVPLKEAFASCCIAISYEAKKFGVKGGMGFREAKRLCPELVAVQARPERYVEVHKQMVKAVGRVLPVEKVMSIDEVSCRLLGDERRPERVAELAGAIKAEIRTIGETLRCSIGVGPNVMLAKVAADMQKPDGLTLLPADELPDALHGLDLEDFPGIGPRMRKRFTEAGIVTVRQLTQLPPATLSRIWGSTVLGWRWWYLLRGFDVPDKPTRTRTVGHGHVLPPELRNEEGARSVLVRLVHKAAARLRKGGHWAGRVVLYVDYPGDVQLGWRSSGWGADRRIGHSQDTFTLLKTAEELWATRPPGKPIKVNVTFADLAPATAATPSMFDHDAKMTELSHVMDQVNRAFGPNSVYLGSMFGRTQNAPMRIAFTHIPDEETESVVTKRRYGV